MSVFPPLPPRLPKPIGAMTPHDWAEHGRRQHHHARAMFGFLDWFLLMVSGLLVAYAAAVGWSWTGVSKWVGVGLGLGGAVLLQFIYRSQKQMAWRTLRLDEEG